MFKKLKSRFAQVFLDKRDCWNNSPSSTKKDVPPLSDDLQVTSPQFPSPSSPQDMRDQLIQGECSEELLSKKSSRVHIVKSSSEIIGFQEKRSFTEDGLVTDSDEYFLKTSDGRFIKSTELHRGGECVACNGFSDKIFHCQICRRSVCFTHFIPWKEFKACPRCFYRLKFNEDTWFEKQGK